nr:tRNA (adenosine(37)-N6)-dimethylallyltransferase MiaA [Deinococcus peraridilitoris]
MPSKAAFHRLAPLGEASVTAPICVLTAPTAAGKTGLSLRLARRHGLEVVSADAFLVYRGMDIGTAKPTLRERAQVRHHLIDIRDSRQEYDVAQFVRDAEAAIADIRRRGAVPLVVGGTGFYLSALLSGLPTTPRADLEVQRTIERELDERGLDALIAEIASVQPGEVERLQRNPRRVVRSLEVYRRTGRFPSQFGRTIPTFTYQIVAFAPPAELLDARIVARVDAMFRQGLVEEVRELLESAPLTDRPTTAWQAIGYKEVAAHLRGERSLDETRAAVVAATRAYAKRQLTWIRTQLRSELLPDDLAAEHRLDEVYGH